MSRLGIWGVNTPFVDFKSFQDSIEKSGPSGMEIVALDLKWQGLYLARQLSFNGSTFKIQECEIETNFERMYNQSVKLWVLIKKYIEKFETQNLKNQYWAAHQRFFRYLCIASKVKEVVSLTKQAIKDNKAVVIGLQSTGEQQTLKQSDSGSISSTAFGVLSDLFKILPNVENKSPLSSQI